MDNQAIGDNKNTQQIWQSQDNTPPAIAEKSRMSYFVTGTILVFCVLVIGYGGYYLGQQTLKSQTTVSDIQNPVVPTETSQLNTPRPSVSVESKSADMGKTYALPQISMSLKIPSFLVQSDELSVTTSHGNLYWNDTPNSPIKLYATSIKSTFQGGFSFLYGCIGYKKTEAGFKFLTYTNSEIAIPTDLAREVTNQNEIQYLIVKSNLQQATNGIPPVGVAEKGYIAAIIKTNNAEYPALVIQMKLANEESENIFNQVLSTFRFEN